MMRKARSHWLSFALSACILCCHVNGQAPSACLTRELTIEPADGGAAMHTVISNFVLTNKGQRTCSLSGYPAAVALDNKGRVVREIVFQHAAPTGGPVDLKVQEIRLAPGEHAWFEIVSDDSTGLEDTSFCKKATMVRITPPLDQQHFHEIFPFLACTPVVSISFLVTGKPD
jgi:hypothetical protein